LRGLGSRWLTSSRCRQLDGRQNMVTHVSSFVKNSLFFVFVSEF